MKKFTLVIITAILFTVPSLCGAGDFEALQPDMAAKIQTLRQQVRAMGGTYEVAYSAAMDRPVEHLAGLKAPSGWNRNDAPSVRMLESTVQSLPSSFDWRSHNGVTPIKDQGNCGDCWAFSTVGALESQIRLQNNKSVDLSEQYLLSCNVDGYSCNGGWWAHPYHMNKDGQDNNGPGAVLAAEKPYTGTDSACGGKYDHPYKIYDWAYVASDDAVPTVQAIKQAIYTYGPISAGVYAGSYFQAYSGGIFNTSESSDKINHAIMLVGWNDDLGPGKGYWILRNSWGTSWGESGYMRIRYGISQVGFGANFIEYGSGPPHHATTTVIVPNVVGDTRTAASSAITGANLVVGTVTIESSTKVASGLVISQTPAAGASVASESAVNLVISSGSSPPPAQKPNLTGAFEDVYLDYSGTTLIGYFAVENIGNAATTTSFRVLLYLSPDGVSKTYLLGSANVTNQIKPGGSVYLEFYEFFESSVIGDSLIAVVDPDNRVPDSNRANNVVVSQALRPTGG